METKRNTLNINVYRIYSVGLAKLVNEQFNSNYCIKLIKKFYL